MDTVPPAARPTFKRTGSSFLDQVGTVFVTPAQNRKVVVLGTLVTALASVVGAALAGAGNIGYAVVFSVLYGMCYGAVFWCAFDPQRHAAWLAPDTWTLLAFLVAMGALGGAGEYMVSSVNPDRVGSGEWLPLYITGAFIINLVVVSDSDTAVHDVHGT